MSKKPGDWWNESWNPVTGCTPISEGCQNCWAQAMENRFGRGFSVQFHPERLEDKRLNRKKITRFFIGSLTDMFHDEVVLSQVGRKILMEIIHKAELRARHRLIFLTKRPHNMVLWVTQNLIMPVDKRIWFLTTIENQARFDERLPHLKNIPAAVRGLHLEPLLGPVDISPALPHVQWVVVGGENGPGARPMHPDWVRNIRDQCVQAGVRFWFKGWGAWVPWGEGSPHGYTGFGCLDRFGNFNNETTTWNGRQFSPEDDYECSVYRVKQNQRLLDGREWNELPEVNKRIESEASK
jgi:protein gp37